ncbi:MAG: O-antigen ligase family protein [Thermoflexales bacterium]
MASQDLDTVLLLSRGFCAVVALLLIAAAVLRREPLRLEWPGLLVALFLGSSAVAGLVSFDSVAATSRLWLIADGIAIFFLAASFRTRDRLIALAVLSALGLLAFCAYFLLTTDWASLTYKGALFERIGSELGRLLPRLRAYPVHPNLAAGVIATALPIQIALCFIFKRQAERATTRRRLWWTAWIALMAETALVVFVFGMTQSRSAWAAVGAAGAVWVFWRGLRFSERARRNLLVIAFGACFLGLAAAELWLLWLTSPSSAASPTSRLSLLAWTWPMAAATPFLGTGLATFGPQFSVYALLLQVGFLPHAHNLFVDLMIEQGAAGLALFTGAQLVALWVGLRASESGPRTADDSLRWLVQAACIAIAIVLFHGVGDDVVYATKWVFLIFLPAGMAIAAAGCLGAPPTAVSARDLARIGALGVAGLAAVALGVSLTPALQAAVFVNAGVVQQARAELSVYRLENWADPTLDLVRARVDLDGAKQSYASALALDPGNLTALQRLASIELSRARYEAGAAYAVRALASGNRDNTTRLIYAEAMAAQGKVDEAVAAASGVPFARGRMAYLGFYRYTRAGDRDRAAWANLTAAGLLVDPVFMPDETQLP